MNILRYDLNFHRYEIAVIHKLQPLDYANCKTFPKQMIELMDDDKIFVMSDKAHFYLDGSNKQNFCYWLNSNLQELHERPLHNAKVTVWCRVTKNVSSSNTF